MRFLKSGTILAALAAFLLGFYHCCDPVADALPPVNAPTLAATTAHMRNIPREHWQVYSVITPQDEPFKYRLEVYKSLRCGFRWSLRRDEIRLEICDSNGRVIDLHGKPLILTNSPDVMAPQIDPDSPRRTTEAVYIPLSIDPSVLGPKIYTLCASGMIDAVDPQTGESIAIPRFSNRIRIYMPPRPRTLPSLTTGQRFLFASPDTEHPYVNAITGKPVPRSAMALHILTLVQVDSPSFGKQVFRFTMDGYHGMIQAVLPHGVDKLPSLYPLVEDDTLDRLRRKYEGKRVWQYGGANALCSRGEAGESISAGGPLSTSWVIRRIVRTYAGGYDLRIGCAPGLVGGETESTFTASNPVFVVLTPSKPLNFESFMSVSDSGVDAGSASHKAEVLLAGQPKSGEYYMVFADAWDFERTYSTANPFATHSDWPRSMRRAITSHELRKGMTHDMAAWAMGWPAEYATIPEMRTLNEWRYDSLRPFDYMVYFRNGRISRFGPTGTLP